jgi:hypothetical protein
LIPYYLCTTHCIAHSNAHYTLFIPEKKCSFQRLHLEGHHPLGSAPRERERKGGGKKKQEQKDTQVLTFNNFFSWEPEITHHMPDAHSQVSQALSNKI